MNRKLFLSVSLVLATAAFAGGSLIGGEMVIKTEKAIWKETYKTPAAMANRADAVVLARAAAVRPGRVAGSENGEDSLAFQLVELEVVDGLKGAARAERISVERSAGLSHDGGGFEIGATYLLFLKKQEDGPYFYQVNLQGRYLVSEGRLWAADPEDRVARTFEGQPVSRRIGRVREELRAGVNR